MSASVCAQSALTPDTPQTPDTQNVSTLIEDCGDGCQRTVTTVQSTETDADGNARASKNVEVIEIKTADSSTHDVDIDVDTESHDEMIVKKKIKVVSMVDGDLTPEMQAKIDSMVAELDQGEHVWKEKGDGVVVVNSSGNTKKTRIVIRENGKEFVTGESDVEIDQVEHEDGSRTIRITPKAGGDTTVITIQKEKSSKSDN